MEIRRTLVVLYYANIQRATIDTTIKDRVPINLGYLVLVSRGIVQMRRQQRETLIKIKGSEDCIGVFFLQ